MNLVSYDFTLCIVLEVAVALKTTLDELPELGSEGFMIVQMMDAESRSRSFAGVSWANAFLRRSDATLFKVTDVCDSLFILKIFIVFSWGKYILLFDKN